MPFPSPEAMKVTTLEELEQRLDKIKTVGSKLRQHADKIKEITGDDHKEFFEGAEERKAKFQEFRARVTAAAGNEEETKKVIDDWNSKVDDMHAKFVGKIEEIKAKINEKFPGGFEAFKAKMGEK